MTELDQLAPALAKFQSVIKNPKRTKTVKGKSYSFDYAPLEEVLDAVRKDMAANGLSLTQLVQTTPEGPILETMLLHVSGQYLKSTSPIPGGASASPQDLGSSITYMRRYCACACLGIASDSDTDGDMAAQAKKTKKKGPDNRGEDKPAIFTWAQGFKKRIKSVDPQNLAGLMEEEVEKLKELQTASETGYAHIIETAEKLGWKTGDK